MNGWVVLLLGAALWASPSVRFRLSSPHTPLRWPARRPPRRSTEAVEELIAALRDELMAGAALRIAFERAAHEAGVDVCPQALAVCRMGGDVPDGLRRDARGDPVLLSLAALWQVGEGSGGALAAALNRLLDGARQAAKVRREVRAQLAGPRATMRVLAGLPVIGVGMGLLMGADPVGFLLGSVWGWLCLAAAVGLEALGVAWMRRLVRGIEAQI